MFMSIEKFARDLSNDKRVGVHDACIMAYHYALMEMKGKNKMTNTSDEPSKNAQKIFESRGFEEGHDRKVNRIKYLAAKLIDAVNDISIPPDNKEVGRLVSLAKTDIESSVMWATKAVSRFNP